MTESIGTPVPFKADFDDAGFPYSGYVLNNPDGAIGWEQTEAAAYSGVGSMYLNNYNYNGIGQEDEFTLPGINLTTTDKAGLSFLLSYAQYGANSGFADTLEVYVSGDCGVSFDRVYQKYGAELATAPATTSEFFPRGRYDWRQEWIDLSDYFEATFLVVRFRHVSNYENNLFIDRVRVSKIFSLANEEALLLTRLTAIQHSDGTVSVRLGRPMAGRGTLRVIDMHGRVVKVSENLPLTRQELDRLDMSGLAAGLYQIRLEGDFTATTSILIR